MYTIRPTRTPRTYNDSLNELADGLDIYSAKRMAGEVKKNISDILNRASTLENQMSHKIETLDLRSNTLEGTPEEIRKIDLQHSLPIQINGLESSSAEIKQSAPAVATLESVLDALALKGNSSPMRDSSVLDNAKKTGQEFERLDAALRVMYTNIPLEEDGEAHVGANNNKELARLVDRTRDQVNLLQAYNTQRLQPLLNDTEVVQALTTGATLDPRKLNLIRNIGNASSLA